MILQNKNLISISGNFKGSLRISEWIRILERLKERHGDATLLLGDKSKFFLDGASAAADGENPYNDVLRLLQKADGVGPVNIRLQNIVMAVSLLVSKLDK